MEDMLVLLEVVRYYAPQMPTGLVDSNARVKLDNELRELDEELAAGRRDDALTELADVGYFVGKSIENALMSITNGRAILESAAVRCSVSIAQIPMLVEAKYRSRAAIGKNKDAERAAIIECRV